GANVAYAATFNREEDIYYVRVTPELATSTIATDFNQDGQPDYLIYNPSTQQSGIWYLNNGMYLRGAYGPSIPAGWIVAGVADFNRDGKPDLAFFNPSTRQTVIWYLNNNLFLGSAAGPTLPPGWELKGVTDFNQDGKPDFVLFNAGTRQSAIWFMNN